MAKRSNDGSPDLFAARGEQVRQQHAPLAERMRPRTLEEFVGQHHLIAPGRLLREMLGGECMQSLILWGPPGCGKTTLAHLVARTTQARFVHFSAILSGVKELRELIEEARQQRQMHGKRTILFVDEIHRFNKAQQDAFLPHVEDGTVTLIGATTENPSFEVIAPLLSRASVLVFEPLPKEAIAALLQRALDDRERGLGALELSIEPGALEFLAEHARGDARLGLNALETSAQLAEHQKIKVIDVALAQEAAQHRALLYDKGGDEHYNIISAFIKSMRGSDPGAAVYWLMRMLEAGEDPMFIARRIVIFAAEDVGNADPQALPLAVAARDALHFVGLPEGRIPLAHAVTYLATAPKSNASYKAMLAAAADVKQYGPLPVPLHLRNAPTKLMKNLGYGRDYKYAHDYEGHVVDQQHLPDVLKDKSYYEPSDEGAESAIRTRLDTRRRKS